MSGENSHQSVSQAVSHSVNFPGGAVIHAYFVVYFKMFAVSIFQNCETVWINTTIPTDLYVVVVQACKIENKETNCSKQYFPCRIFKFFPPEHPIGPSVEPKHG